MVVCVHTSDRIKYKWRTDLCQANSKYESCFIEIQAWKVGFEKKKAERVYIYNGQLWDRTVGVAHRVSRLPLTRRWGPGARLRAESVFLKKDFL